MVSYQKWTQIAFETAKQKGMKTSQSNSQDLVSVSATIWNERKSELSSATQHEAERIAKQEIEVSR